MTDAGKRNDGIISFSTYLEKKYEKGYFGSGLGAIKDLMKIISILVIYVTTFLPCYSQGDLVHSQNTFAFTIYDATKPDSANFFISPLGLNISLAIANEGARADTRNELNRLLSVDELNSNVANLYNELLSKTINLEDSLFQMSNQLYPDRPGNNELYLSNSIWINNRKKINTDYINTIKGSYHSDVFSFNNDKIQRTNEEIDTWVSEATNQKIQHISGLKSNAALGILNAIYFMGEWEMPFDNKATKSKKFRTLTKQRINVDYLRKKSMYKYYEDENMQAVFLPYRHEQFSMLVLLPTDTYGILGIENVITWDYLQKLEKSSTYKDVILSLPKFKIETEISPIEELKILGYRQLFSDKANFAGISSTDSLKISEIIQKTFIQIDEKKTEAAAVTKVEVVVTGYAGGEPPVPPPPIVFKADHPFMFIIKDNRTNAILFIGRFVME